MHKFDYRWTLADAHFTKDKGTVFSCFACGGGSSMGYKLAGYNVIGCNELDPRMNALYIANHHPKYNYCEDIREFANREDLPTELYQLDVLDGSPPCSSFSVAGSREEGWGKEKRFKEGQKKQVLDTLFFDFIGLAKKLQPKVVIAENVKGLLMGEARKYTFRIYEALDEAGYYVQHFLLNAAQMGVPQARERVFFVCLRKDLATPFLEQKDLFTEAPTIDMAFNENPITLQEVAGYRGRQIPQGMLALWQKRQYGDNDICNASLRENGKLSMFNNKYVYPNRVCLTLAAREDCLIHYDEPKYLSKDEVNKISSFPSDYDYQSQQPHYVCGMSVPPVMMAQVASRIYDQWLSKIRK